jgi:hypothetical protein
LIGECCSTRSFCRQSGIAVVMQPDDKLLILGSLVDEARWRRGAVLVRLNPDGKSLISMLEVASEPLLGAK